MQINMESLCQIGGTGVATRRISNSGGNSEFAARVSIWIERGHTYALTDGDDAWTGTFTGFWSLSYIRGVVATAAKEKESLRTALALGDYYVRREAVVRSAQALDPDRLIWPAEVRFFKETSAQAGHEETGLILTTLLDRELQYWKRTAPGLKAGWSVGVNAIQPAGPISHLWNTLGIIRFLSDTPYNSEAEAVVRQLRAYWSSVPQLSSDDRLVQACDSYLATARK
jgi:hypothetical protein